MLESHCPPRKIELLTLRAKVMIPYYTEVSLVGLYSSTLSELETHLVVLLRWSECSPVRMTAESTSVDYRSFTSLKLSMGVTHRQGKVQRQAGLLTSASALLITLNNQRIWNEQAPGPCGHPRQPHQPHLGQGSQWNKSGGHYLLLPKQQQLQANIGKMLGFWKSLKSTFQIPTGTFHWLEVTKR